MTTEQLPDDSSETLRSLFFTCGCVISRETVVIPAQYNAFPDEDMSRVALKFGDVWGYHDVDNDVIGSVAFRRTDQSLWLLGRNGVVRTAGGDGRPFTAENARGAFREEIMEHAPYGELLCIRVIAGRLYVCGQSSQVYVRNAEGWTHFDHGILAKVAPDLESIDGTSDEDIYAVGENGSILHFDGKQWQHLQSPTKSTLSTVRCVSRQEVLICGNDGTVFRGNKNSWQFIGDAKIKHNFWDLEIYGERLYLSHVGGMLLQDGKRLVNVDFGLGEKISCHKLHAEDGVLWSFGVDDLMFYDGLIWTRIVCPENA